VESRRWKCGVDSKRGTFNNLNRLHPTPNTTVLPCCQDNPLLYNRRHTFHIIRLPLRRLPHPLRPLLPSHPLPLAQDSIARLVTTAAHPPVGREDGLMYALRLQREYDDEDRALSVQCTQLANCSGLLRTFLTPLSLRTPALLLFLFYLAIGHGTTPFP